MKVILKDDIPSIGNFGDLIQVANGYARNYLIPKGLAVEATAGNQKMIEQQKKAWLRRLEQTKEELRSLKERIEATSVSISKKVGESEKLFGSVTSIDIIDALKEHGFDIERKKVHMDEPIKSLGEFTVPIKLHKEVTAYLKVSVVKE